MSGTRYRRGGLFAADMASYAQALSAGCTNAEELGRVKLALFRALNEDITEKQRKYLLLYYGEGKNMVEIGQEFGVDKSTVSRTIKRGEARLRRCLRYGAKSFLLDESPAHGLKKHPKRGTIASLGEGAPRVR